MKTFLSILVATIALSTAVRAETPINEECPVCGKQIRLIFRTKTREGVVAFDTNECMEKYKKAPGSYKVKKADK